MTLSDVLRGLTTEIVRVLLLLTFLFVFFPRFVFALTAEWVGEHLAGCMSASRKCALVSAGKLIIIRKA